MSGTDIGHRLCLPYALCGIGPAHNATSPCRTPSLAIVLRGKLPYQPTFALFDVQYCHTTTVLVLAYVMRVIDVAYPSSPCVHTLSGTNAAVCYRTSPVLHDVRYLLDLSFITLCPCYAMPDAEF
eukprot:3619007-Rhodomonas_salina.1